MDEVVGVDDEGCGMDDEGKFVVCFTILDHHH
jgi:hypothetical protein